MSTHVQDRFQNDVSRHLLCSAAQDARFVGKAAWLKDWHAARAINEPFAWEMNSTTQDGSRSVGREKDLCACPETIPTLTLGLFFQGGA